MIIRSYLAELEQRMAEKRKFIQVLMGPRQVGKTTLIKQLIKKLTVPYVFVTADDTLSDDPLWIEQQWQSVRLKMEAQNYPESILIIDEIQRIRDWSKMVKKLWDEDSFNDTPIKVILLGSARLLLQQGLSESMAGRFESMYIGHWSLQEMNEAFGLTPEQYAWFGGYPGSADLIQDETRWKAYIRNSLIESVISKDIVMLNQVKKPALLRNVFELGAHYSAQILSYNKMLGQLQDAGNTTTLLHYQMMLESAGLLSGLEKYASQAFRKRASIPKWQVHNMALFSAVNGSKFDEVSIDAKAWGRVIESAIGAHLVKAHQKVISNCIIGVKRMMK